MFRRLVFTGHSSTFWEDVITSGRDYDSNGNKKTHIQMARTEIPAEVLARCSGVAQLDAAVAEAVQCSFMYFMEFVGTLRSPDGAELRGKIKLVEMKHVAIKCEGRSGPYDLMYFPHKDAIYAADSRSDDFVYILE
jgi:hypothetical protein